MLYEFVLILTIIMPEGQRDMQKRFPMESLQQCQETSQSFVVAEDIHKKIPEAIGLGAGCAIIEKKTDPS